jgi:hypothetical protein
MAQIDPVDIIKYVQSEIAALKHAYNQGKIDIKTLQTAARPLNNVAQYASFLASQKNET